MLVSSCRCEFETLRGAEIIKLRQKEPERKILETNVIADRMDNESHQLGCLGDLDLPPHDARHLVVCLRDGGRYHEPDEVGKEYQV